MAIIDLVFQKNRFQNNVFQVAKWGAFTFQKNVFQGITKDVTLF